MAEIHPTIKKLQLKDFSKSVLIINAPEEFEEVVQTFQTDVHKEIQEDNYHFIQVFGKAYDELKDLALQVLSVLEDDGLLWLCYPKKSSKKYKGTDCSRDNIVNILAEKDYEGVRQVAIDEDWSALRLRHVDKIKIMKRKTAASEKGKKRIGDK